MSRLHALALLLPLAACQENTEPVNNCDTAVEEEATGPVELLTLDEIMGALMAGRSVRSTLDYGACLLDGEPGPAAIGGMAVDTWEWFDEGVIDNDMAYIAFSKSSLIAIYGDYLYDYVKVRIYQDGSVEILAEYIDPATWATEMSEEFTCTLGESVVLTAE